MAMNEILMQTIAGATGILLGGFFFGGLWWTIQKGLASPRPALWFLGSLLVRMGVVLTGFYFVGRENWKNMVACLLGFILARLIVGRLTRPSRKRSKSETKEAVHAP